MTRPLRSAERAADARLGRAIRARRRELGLTLVQVAAASGLSQPFLSQLELGRTRPSMRSLYRIAEALRTSQQSLLSAAGDGEAVEVGGGAGPGARLLHHAEDGAAITEFVGLPREFAEFFSHGREEVLYVVRGTIEVELQEAEGSRRVLLGERGTLAYPGSTPHRYRQVGSETAIVLVVHSGA
ncbi:XRE family transcriptional regulator [Pseudonocardia xishanensis]|uniref:HTH cro/C1-type domain-containing protein n=1 Tax=Pseudonocardia xishanensis TaxID=630995 RepID=A0ABP8RF56_9PSEU